MVKESLTLEKKMPFFMQYKYIQHSLHWLRGHSTQLLKKSESQEWHQAKPGRTYWTGLTVLTRTDTGSICPLWRPYRGYTDV